MTIGGTDKQRPKELCRITVDFCKGKRTVTCYCGDRVVRSIVPHLKKVHPDKWSEWVHLFVELRSSGFPLKRIMRVFSDSQGTLLFSWTVVERAIRDAVESNEVSYIPPRKKVITRWEPGEFQLETTTVWDFLRRGSWGVHSGDYRGNWPPQLVRNLIQRYTLEGDVVVDPFMGGGTTLFEAWILERKSIGLDVSRLAVQTTMGRLREMEEAACSSGQIVLNREMRPVFLHGDALQLRKIIGQLDETLSRVTLACVHPPYLNALQYTKDDEDDLSRILDPKEFAKRINIVAIEIRNILEPGGVCALLMGDVRRGGHLVPLGYQTLQQFLTAGFELQDTIIKYQHRDRSSEFYARNSKQLLLSHEYLFILKKPQ